MSVDLAGWSVRLSSGSGTVLATAAIGAPAITVSGGYYVVWGMTWESLYRTAARLSYSMKPVRWC